MRLAWTCLRTRHGYYYTIRIVLPSKTSFYPDCAPGFHVPADLTRDFTRRDGTNTSFYFIGTPRRTEIMRVAWTCLRTRNCYYCIISNVLLPKNVFLSGPCASRGRACGRDTVFTAPSQTPSLQNSCYIMRT